jgi:hypothetical protein
LVVFMGGYALRKDDRIELMLTAPDGTPIVQHPQFQQRDQARNMYFAGRKRPPEGWQAGMWTARVAVTREGETWTQDRTFELAPAQ